MICYFINSHARTITEAEFLDSGELRELIGGYLEVAWTWRSGDTLYVDEEGLLKEPEVGFRLVDRMDQPFAGNGVLVGREYPDQTWTTTHSNQKPYQSILQLREAIRFIRFVL